MSSSNELITDPFAPANVSDLTDVLSKDHKMDCYYATLAGILHKTVPELEEETQIEATEGKKLYQIQSLYDKAGYTGEFLYFAKRADFKKYLLTLFKEEQKKLNQEEKKKLKMKLAAGFMWKDHKCGHMVAVKAWYEKDQFKYRVVDFQVDKNHRFVETIAKLPEDSEVDYYCARDPIFYS